MTIPMQGGGNVGKIRNPWTVIGLTIITCGLYHWYWFYMTFQEMKDYSAKGIGGLAALLFAFICAIINIFVEPSEIASLYEADGRESPVSIMTGFWILLPILGGFIWIFKIQSALNGFWESKGAVAE
jgi:hypothetical protein